MTVLHIVFDLAVTASVIAECAWVAGKSRTLAAIVVLGLGLRVASGIALFAVSYFDMGILRGLHTGGGFWVLAIDAQGYYAFAAAAAARSPLHVSWDVPSPCYVAALALWLRATGISVIAAILFNVACYAVTVAALVAGLGKVDRRDRFGWPAIVLAAFSFSPVLLLTSTQTLKDPFFVMLSVIVCRTAFEIFEGLKRVRARGALALPTMVGLAVIAVGLVSGLRAYDAAFLWLGFAAGFVALVAVPGPAPLGRLKLTFVSTTVLALLWLAIMIGGGPYYRLYQREITRFGVATAVEFNRTGFERTGGATNMSPPVASTTARAGPIPQPAPARPVPQPAPAAPIPQRAVAAPTLAVPLQGAPLSTSPRRSAPAMEDPITIGGLRHLTTGLLAMLVPVSILKALSIVTFAGGRGLLFVADLDTVFLDLSLLAIGAVIVRERPRLVARAPSLLFTLVVLGVATILLAYVVTNFGTLFRLRLLAAVPAWMAPFAFRSRRD